MSWTTFSTAIKGRNKTQCQDATYAAKTGHHIILAVADGVGSHRHSALGSQRAIQLVRSLSPRLLESSLPSQDICRRLFSQVVHQWSRWAHSLPAADTHAPQFNNVQTTFAIAVIENDNVSVLSIGDSLLFVQGHSGPFLNLLPVQRSDSGSVNTVGDIDTGARPRELKINDPTMSKIVLTTDGVERLLMRRPTSDTDEKPFHYVHGALLATFDGTDFRDGESKQKLIDSISQGLIHRHGAKGDDVGIAAAFQDSDLPVRP